MTRQTFYRNLRKAAMKLPFTNNYGIRSDSKAGSFCPITAVLYHKTGEKISTGNYARAAHELCLSDEDTRLILDAADGSIYKNRESKMVKQALLRAVGLAKP